MYDKDGRDFVVEECARQALCTMVDLDTSWRFTTSTFIEVTLEVGHTVLVSIDLIFSVNMWIT